MRIQTLTAMMAAVGANVWAGEIAATPERSVTVCMHSANDGLAAYMAKAEASKIFAKIGVRLLWRDRRSCTADSSVIVSFSYQTPQTDHPAALAYALPYDGSR